eukprot:RCo030041
MGSRGKFGTGRRGGDTGFPGGGVPKAPAARLPSGEGSTPCAVRPLTPVSPVRCMPLPLPRKLSTQEKFALHRARKEVRRHERRLLQLLVDGNLSEIEEDEPLRAARRELLRA